MIPKFVPSPTPSEEVVRAAYELIAQALRQGTPVYNLTLSDAKHGDQPIGSWEVSVRRLD